MQITRNSVETAAGPSEWFTGRVYIDTVATPSEQSRGDTYFTVMRRNLAALRKALSCR